ncbi:glycosyltransferase [Lacinutrix undariae]
MKPSILIIADFPNWAYYEIQQFVAKSLSDEFDFYCDFLIYNTKIKSKHPIRRIKSYLDKKKYSYIKPDCNYDIVFYLGYYFEEQMKVDWTAKKVIKGIYTDGFPPSNANFTGTMNAFLEHFFKDAAAMACGSKQILETYNNYYDNCYNANMILDTEFFKRKSEKKNTNFTIGWTGNPKRDFKGYYSHIVPAIEKLQLTYSDIKLKSRFSGPMETLPNFYEDVDIVVIASDADAGPSLFGEASLMDVPTVSTNVGWPENVIKNNVNGFIVEKDINEIVDKIEQLYLDRVLLNSMSKRIRKDFIEIFNREDAVGRWRTMFNEVLES